MEGGGERVRGGKKGGGAEEGKGVANEPWRVNMDMGEQGKGMFQTVGNHREIYGRGRARGKEDIWKGVCKRNEGFWTAPERA